ncbi:SCO3374 family protein [Streptomyces sp. NPDC055952]|uniref:SCO3374 family protein n=1 Tax=Streptomyces sp. NPDC055952 TaxID=3345663 RepID=UPI0035D5B540
MSGTPHAVTPAAPAAAPAASRLVPLPRRPLDPGAPGAAGSDPADRVRRWYEDELGWPTAPGDPVRLLVGVRFDVLDVPAEAGRAALRHLVPGSPVAARGARVQLLVAPGSAEELPGLLEWLDWGTLPLDLSALGTGGLMEAPRPCGPDAGASRGPAGPGVVTGQPGPGERVGSQGAAVWLRPPEPGCEAQASLPTLSALGGGGDAPDLVRLVDTVATWCHRTRLRRAGARPPASPARGR